MLERLVPYQLDDVRRSLINTFFVGWMSELYQMPFGRASNIVIKQMLYNNVGTCNRRLIMNNEAADVRTKTLRFEISVWKDIARLRN